MPKFFITAILFLLLPTTTVANNNNDKVSVGRYTLVTPSATPEQSSPLSVVINISFGTNITNVGEALQHLLIRSGYRLADLDAADPYLPILFSRPLPQVHRHLGPITLHDALITLAGPAWYLSVDPVNRLISYELLDKFRPADVSVNGKS
ncbi:MAG: hypothetical protein L3K25_07555 [Gammaproteobacteria bacterium]|nr:hypothetical protein [Gammaproteobacteria bacterium]